jgi:hypothetical protein
MSKFIEASKHPGLTKMVNDHFSSGGGADASRMTPGAVKGDNASNALPSRAKDFPFNPESGVNYVPDSRAGHKV